MRFRRIAALVAAGALATSIGVAGAGSALAAPVPNDPTGTLISPAAGTQYGPGASIPLLTQAKDTPVAGYPLGVTVVEWWMYSDSFGAQYPTNHEDKIFLGESHQPISGTQADGTWSAPAFVVPADGKVTVTRDGESPGGLAAPRTYTLAPGTYEVQSHLQNAWWLAHTGNDPGKTQMNAIALTGTPVTPPPTTPPPTTTPPVTPPPTTPPPTAPPVTPPPAQPAVNLVTSPSVEPGVPAGCWPLVHTSGDGVVFASGLQTTPVHVHSGKRALALWWVAGPKHLGDAKYLTGLSSCSPKVTPGKSYAASVWYKLLGTKAHLTFFRQDAAGRWVYWTDLKTLPQSPTYAKASVTTPPVPAGTQRVAFGVSLADSGILVTDDYSFTQR